MVSGTLHEMIEGIVNILQSLKKPLLIIDEADKLSDSCLNIFKTLYNRLKKQCGFILCGAPYFKIRIEKGVNRRITSYNVCYTKLLRIQY